jgi:hypothetical protein
VIRAVIDEALAAKEAGEEKVILFSYSGHGLLDLAAYDDYLHGRLDLGRTGLSAASTAGRPSEPSPDRAD